MYKAKKEKAIENLKKRKEQKGKEKMICNFCIIKNVCKKKLKDCEVVKQFEELDLKYRTLKSEYGELENYKKQEVLKLEKLKSDFEILTYETLEKFKKILLKKDELFKVKDKEEEEPIIFVDKDPGPEEQYIKGESETGLEVPVLELLKSHNKSSDLFEDTLEKFDSKKKEVIEKKHKDVIPLITKEMKKKHYEENIKIINEKAKKEIENVKKNMNNKNLCLTCEYLFEKTYEFDKKVVCLLDIERGEIKGNKITCKLYKGVKRNCRK